MLETHDYLVKLEETLIPFRHRSAINQTPDRIAAALVALSSETPTNADEQTRFFRLFADALFFVDENGVDRRGAAFALSGLAEVIDAAVEWINAPFEFFRKTLGALEEFKTCLEQFELIEHGADFFDADLDKKDNVIAYYLARTRSYFFLPQHLKEVLQTDAAAPTAAIEMTVEQLDAAYTFFRRRSELKQSDEQIKKLIELLPDKKGSRPPRLNNPRTIKLLRRCAARCETRWRKLCLAGYRATRIAVETPAEKELIYRDRSQRSARVVEVTMRFLPGAILDQADVFLEFNRGAIHDAYRACYAARKYVFKTFDQYHRIAYYLLRGKPYPWRAVGARRKLDALAKNARIARLLDPTAQLETGAIDFYNQASIDADPTPHSNLWIDNLQEQIREGAAPDEFALVETGNRSKRQAPPGSAANSQAFRPPDEYPPWARNRLTAETLGVIWWRLDERAAEQPENPIRAAVLAFVELQLVYGFAPDALLSAQRARSFDEPATLPARNRGKAKSRKKAASETLPHSILTFDDDRIGVAPRRGDGGAAFGTIVNQAEVYLPSSGEFHFQLSARSRELLDRFAAPLAAWENANPKLHARAERQLLFSFFDPNDGKPTALTRPQLNRELKTVGELLGEPVTPEKIAASVVGLWREEFGLHSLLAHFLTGEIPRRSASQLFYTSYGVGEILRAHHIAADGTVRLLNQESRAYKQKLAERFNRPFFDQQPMNLPALVSTESAALANDDSLVSRIGSPFVPRPDLFADYLKTLRESIFATSDWILRHNRCTAYAVLTLMSITGLRPLEIFDLTRAEFTAFGAAPSLSVLAKVNRVHREWRVLPLAPEAVRILSDYQRFAHATRTDLRLLERYSRLEWNNLLGDGLFFSIRRTLTPVRLTTRNLRELLSEKFLEMPDFAWRTNSPRHLYRTTAVELKIPEEIVDALLGHQTSGAEALGRFSAHNRNLERRSAETIAGEIWKRLKLRYVAENDC